MTDTAGATITASFSSRRQADLAIEHLVQEHAIERTNIFVVSGSDENSVGVEADGADEESGHPGTESGGDPALSGAITVSVDLEDEEKLASVHSVIEQFGGTDIASE